MKKALIFGAAAMGAAAMSRSARGRRSRIPTGTIHTGRFNDLGNELVVFPGRADWGEQGWFVGEQVNHPGREPFVTPKIFYYSKLHALDSARTEEFWGYPEGRSARGRRAETKQLTKRILASLDLLSHHEIKPKVDRHLDGTSISFYYPPSMAEAYIEDHLNEQLGSQAAFTVDAGPRKIRIFVGLTPQQAYGTGWNR